MSTEVRRQQELFRKSIFELGVTEGSGGCVCVWETARRSSDCNGVAAGDRKDG